MARASAEIAFTPAVRKIQRQQGVADLYEEFFTADADRSDTLGQAEAAFISARDGFYQATVSQTGWPYVQFRGGPVGFLKVLDESTIAYADFRGNQQYISTGNLSEIDKISLILMDYPNRKRIKIWGRAKLIDKKDDPELLAKLQIKGYRGLPERAVVIAIEAFDWNCPQHIPQRLTLQELEPHLSQLQRQIIELRQENQELKSFLNQSDETQKF